MSAAVPGGRLIVRWCAGLFVCLCVGALVPIWAFDHWLTQDGPGHVYAARVLLHLWSGPSPYDAWYEPATQLVPNLGGGLLLAALSSALPGAVAERVLASVVVLGLCLSTLVWVRGRSGVAWPAIALLIPPMALNTTLYLGFYSYGLGLALLPLVWRLAFHGTRRAWAAAGALTCLTWLCHLLPALLCLLGIGVAGLWQALAARRVGPALLAAAAGAPTLLASFVWRGVDVRGDWTWSEPLSRLELTATLRAAAPFVGPLEPLCAALAVTLGVLAIRRWRAQALPDAKALAALGLLVTLLALVAPEGGPGFWYVGERVALIPWLVVAALGAAGPTRLHVATLATLSATILIAHTTGVSRLQDKADDADAVLYGLEAGSTVVVLDFERPVGARFAPFVHYVGYAAAQAALVDLSNHEAEAGHFQLRYRPWVRGLDAQQLIGRTDGIPFEAWAPRVRYIAIHSATDEQLARASGTYRELRRRGDFRLMVSRAPAQLR